MSEYYQRMMELGNEFQDYVADVLAKTLGINITAYMSQKYQYNKGENRQGIEIKFDDKYKQTGNLYIEIAEKREETNNDFVDSGIYRQDNTWLYVIGNYNIIFIFFKKFLVCLHKTHKYEEVKTPTSKGFLLPKKDAEKYSGIIIIIDDNKVMIKSTIN